MATILVHTRLLRGMVPPSVIVSPTGRTWSVRVWDDNQIDWRADLREIESTLPPGPVLVHASLVVARWLLGQSFQLPRLSAGVILPESALYAHALNGVLDDLALNRTALYAPFGTLASLGDVLDRAIGPDRFLRPDSPMKPFAGRPISAGEWEREIHAIASIDRPDPGLLCMVAPLRVIAQPEWRFWCVEGIPVAAAPYSFEGEPLLGRPAPDLQEAAQCAALRLLGADSLMVVDIVRDEEGVARCVEANGFSTSGFYPGVDFGALWGAATSVFADG